MGSVQYPSVYSFPDVLTFVAQDNDGNRRDVAYYRADAHIRINGTVGDVFQLSQKQISWETPPRGGSSQQDY